MFLALRVLYRDLPIWVQLSSKSTSRRAKRSRSHWMPNVNDPILSSRQLSAQGLRQKVRHHQCVMQSCSLVMYGQEWWTIMAFHVRPERYQKLPIAKQERERDSIAERHAAVPFYTRRRIKWLCFQKKKKKKPTSLRAYRVCIERMVPFRFMELKSSGPKSFSKGLSIFRSSAPLQRVAIIISWGPFVAERNSCQRHYTYTSCWGIIKDWKQAQLSCLL